MQRNVVFPNYQPPAPTNVALLLPANGETKTEGKQMDLGMASSKNTAATF